jgi:hypothetical protein
MAAFSAALFFCGGILSPVKAALYLLSKYFAIQRKVLLPDAFGRLTEDLLETVGKMGRTREARGIGDFGYR